VTFPASNDAAEVAPLGLLCVGADSALRQDLALHTRTPGVSVTHAPDEAAGLRALESGTWNVALVVLNGDPENQLRRWDSRLRELRERPRMIALVPAPSMVFTLTATHLGASDVLSLPVAPEQLDAALHRARVAAAETPIPLPDVKPLAIGPHAFVSQSSSVLDIYRTVMRVGPSTASVLVLGESGTGKEMLARAIHESGPRAAGPFVALNCAAIPENLLESEVFGHEKGAFTGAIARKVGRFERAHGGTLLLDEIGDMSLALQNKILRALEEREIDRVGGTHSIPVDVRLVAATNRDLPAMIEEGRFREDLYYRLAVVTLVLPPLASRGEDVLLLTAHFLREFQKQYGKSFSTITDRALEQLRNHPWPGNVRELRNVIERVVLVAEGDVIRSEHLPDEWGTPPTQPPPPLPGGGGRMPTLLELEAKHISDVLIACDRKIGTAARILGVHRNTLTRKMKEHGL